MTFLKLWLSTFMLVTVSSANAAIFHNPSLTYLYGENFLVEPDKQHAFSFEYAAAWEQVDLFLFVEKKYYSDSSTNLYSEFSPRFKLAEFGNNALIKKLTFATTFERGSGGVKANLFGLGFDFNSSYFNYLTSNIYRKDAPSRPGHGWQLTSTWGFTTQLFELPLLIDGYIDWVFWNSESERHFHFNPQIKIDMKKLLNSRYQWYAGIEYDYWKNKYGIRDTAAFASNNNTVSLLVKYHF